MTPHLYAALLECRARRGVLTGIPDGSGNGYVLKLCHLSMRPYKTFRLDWPDYFAAYCYWQELSRPGTGMMGLKKGKAA